MDAVAQLVLTSVIWGPALVVLYWTIRLAVRHGTEDAHKAQVTARRWAAVNGAARRNEATYGDSERE